MRDGWRTRSVDDLCVRVTSGGTPRRQRDGYYTTSELGTPWVKTKELNDCWITDTEEFVTPLGIAESSAKLLPANTVMMAMYGATVGKLGLLRTAMTCNQACCAMVVDPDEGDFRFLFYRLLNDREKLIGLANGAAQQNLSGAVIKGYAFPCPPVEGQRRVAAVLGALDDLIDTNQQLCESIQELSRALYSKFARAAGGIRTLSEVATVNPDSIKAQTEGRIQYLDIAALNDGGMEAPRPIQWNEAPSRARRTAASEDTLWSTVRPNRRGHALLLEPADDLVVSTGIAVIRPRNIGFSELYAATDRPEFVEYLMTRAQGSAYPAVRANDIEDAPLPELDVEDAAAFEAIMAPLWHAFGRLTTEQDQARRTRDELLPLLISGAVTPGDVTVAS